MHGIFEDDGWRDGLLFVSYVEDDFPAQCGAVILSGFWFNCDEGRPTTPMVGEAGVKFAQDLIAINQRLGRATWAPLTGAKFVASAVVGSALWAFLDNEYWTVGTIRRNRNSGRQIAIFELDIKER